MSIYYASPLERAMPLIDVAQLEDTAWLNRVVGAALGRGAMALTRLTMPGLYFINPKTEDLKDSPQTAYSLWVAEPDEQSQLSIPQDALTYRKGQSIQYLDRTPEVPIVFRDTNDKPHIYGLVFRDSTPPDILQTNLGLDTIRTQ